jgi:hypothetical protein
MAISPRSFLACAAACAALAVAGSGSAQEPDTGGAYLVVLVSCPKMFVPTLSDPLMAPVQGARKADIRAVCHCAAKATLADPRLKELARASNSEVQQRLSDALSMSYFIARAIQAATCMSTELDGLLRDVTLSR